MRTKRILSTLLLAAFPLTGLAAGHAAPEGDASFVQLRDVAQKAIVNNPEVNAKYHNFRASVEEVGVAFGGYLPRVDVVAGAGREYIKEPVFSGPTNSPVSVSPAWVNEVDGALNPVPVSLRLRDEGLTSSKRWLRVYMTYNVGAGGSPRLDQWRQLYDCIANE